MYRKLRFLDLWSWQDILNQTHPSLLSKHPNHHRHNVIHD